MLLTSMLTVEPTDTPRTAARLIADLERVRGASCAGCGRVVCGHAALMSIVMGFMDAPRCLPCLAGALDRQPGEFRDHLYTYLQRQDCHRTAWEWANTAEGFAQTSLPACLFPKDGGAAGTVSGNVGVQATTDSVPATPHAGKNSSEANSSEALPHHAEWDAGELGCGELVLELRLKLQTMQPGNVFRLCARDAGVPEDLPAWCRLTGHRLLRAEHPNYWIQRKE